MQGTAEADVNREDQGYINEFSRLYSKNKILDSEILKINEVLDSLKDAESGIEESFGATIKLSIGEVFIESDENGAKSHIAHLRKKYEKEKKEKLAVFESNKTRLGELKVILYAKFQNRLRLDED